MKAVPKSRYLQAGDVLLFACVAGILATHFAGYRYGESDHIEQLPLVLRAIDSSFLPMDFFTSAAQGFGPRASFTTLIALIASRQTLPTVYFLLTLLSNIGIAGVTGFTARRMFPHSRLAPLLAIGVVMSVPTFQLSEEGQLFADALYPRTLAMPWILGAIWLGLAGRPLAAASLGGVAALSHPILGLEAGALGWGLALTARGWEARKRGAASRLTIFLGALVLLLGTAALYFPYAARSQLPIETFAEIVATFRHPHHYLLSTFSAVNLLSAGVFLIGAVAVWVRYRRLDSAPPAVGRRLLYFGLAILGMLLAGYVFVEVVPSRLLIAAQPFRLLLLIKWLALMLAAGVAAVDLEANEASSAFPSWFGVLSSWTFGLSQVGLRIAAVARSRANGLAGLLGREALLVIVVAVLLLAGNLTFHVVALFALLALLALSYLGSGVRMQRLVMSLAVVLILILIYAPASMMPRSGLLLRLQVLRPQLELTADSEHLRSLSRYARAETSSESIFVTPPLLGKFRLLAERAIVVDFKAFPFEDQAMLEWRRRLSDVYGEVRANGFKAADEFDENYLRIDDERLQFLQQHYGATHAVLYRTTLTTYEVLYEDDLFKIVLLDDR